MPGLSAMRFCPALGGTATAPTSDAGDDAISTVSRSRNVTAALRGRVAADGRFTWSNLTVSGSRLSWDFCSLGLFSNSPTDFAVLFRVVRRVRGNAATCWRNDVPQWRDIGGLFIPFFGTRYRGTAALPPWEEGRSCPLLDPSGILIGIATGLAYLKRGNRYLPRPPGVPVLEHRRPASVSAARRWRSSSKPCSSRGVQDGTRPQDRHDDGLTWLDVAFRDTFLASSPSLYFVSLRRTHTCASIARSMRGQWIATTAFGCRPVAPCAATGRHAPGEIATRAARPRF